MKTRYLTKFDEINSLIQTAYQKGTGEERRKSVEDTILDLLVDAYVIGVGMASEDFKRKPEYDSYLMYEIIYKEIAGEDVTDRIRKHLADDDLPALKTLAESEFHRVANESSFKTAEAIAPSGTKTWMTMEDEWVRSTHDFLQDVTVGMSDVFVTWDGDEALCPGDFSRAENNVNCRCVLTYRQGSL